MPTKTAKKPAPKKIKTAAELGYRMPGEFEPLDAVWLTYPHNIETWPGCFEKACAQYDRFIEALREFVPVEVLGRTRNWKTGDSWVRDYGPIFVVNQDARPGKKLACHDFVFNGWGGKYGGDKKFYAGDDAVPTRVAKLLKIPVWQHRLVLEGGSIDVNGRGTVMTTEQCLLNKNRNPRKTRDQIIAEVHAALGTRHVVWLPGGIIGDDTDGHIDDIARFVNPTTVVACHPQKSHPDYPVLAKNFDVLKSAKDQDGRKLDLVELPHPNPILYDFPPDRFGPGGKNPVPASHANFLIANGGVLVPIFGQKSDAKALRVIEKAMPGKKIVGVRSEYLVVGLGALHCLSQQQPAV
jgi:agmatine deiminase